MKDLLLDLCCTIEKIVFSMSTCLSVNLSLIAKHLGRAHQLLHLLLHLLDLEDDDIVVF